MRILMCEKDENDRLLCQAYEANEVYAATELYFSDTNSCVEVTACVCFEVETCNDVEEGYVMFSSLEEANNYVRFAAKDDVADFHGSEFIGRAVYQPEQNSPMDMSVIEPYIIGSVQKISGTYVKRDRNMEKEIIYVTDVISNTPMPTG